MIIPTPPVVWRPAHANNYTLGRAPVLIEAVMLHATDSADSPAPYFQNPASGVSSEFGVLPDGVLEQYVSLTNTPHAQGEITVTYDAAPRLMQENWGLSPNTWAVAIETVGTTAQILKGERPTQEQLTALIRSVAWLFQSVILPNANRTGAVLDRDHVLMHRQVNPLNRRCPVWGEDIQSLIIDGARALLDSGGPIPSDDAELIDELTRRALSWRWPPDLILSLAWGESEFDQYALGDGGDSFGVFQVQPRWWGYPGEQWFGVPGALRAMETLKSKWLAAYDEYGGASAWQADPVGFFTRWWPKAQGAVTPSHSRAVESVSMGQRSYAAWKEAQQQPEPTPEPEPEPVDWKHEYEIQRANAEIMRDALTLEVQALDVDAYAARQRAEGLRAAIR